MSESDPFDHLPAGSGGIPIESGLIWPHRMVIIDGNSVIPVPVSSDGMVG